MATLKITTNLPELQIIIFDSRLQIFEEYRMKGLDTNPHRLIGGTNDFESVEEELEIKLKPDLYKIRLELPYFFQSHLEDGDAGVKSSRRVAEKIIDLTSDDSVVSLKFNATLIEE